MADTQEAGKKGERLPFNTRMMCVDGQDHARRILEELGADRGGIAIMSRKMQHAVIVVENVQARAANILKQVMLSRGGECATPREVFLVEHTEPVTVVLMGTVRQLREAVMNLSVQPFGLSALAAELKELIRREFTGSREAVRLEAGGRVLESGAGTLLMGVINVTPDSFSDGGTFFRFESALEHALEMVEAGVDIVDIGGESTRPNALPVSEEEETARTVPLVKALADRCPVTISIDTSKSGVARRALDAGAFLVNDVSALRFDPDMVRLLAERGAPVVLMHMQGTPADMQDDPTYDDVVADVARFLLERARVAMDAGVARESIIIDPGIGFGKTLEHNLEIMRRLGELKSLGFPLLVGVSRKAFIGGVLGLPVDQRLFGTAATVALAVAGGADIVRVHDVREMSQVARMTDAIKGTACPPGARGGR